MRTFDRVPQFDDASRRYPIRTLVQGRKPRSYTWSCDVWLDQGSHGYCVGYAWAHELAARPVVVPQVTDDTANSLYWTSRRWANLPDNEEGSTVLAGAKAAMQAGRLKEYRWAFDLDDWIAAIGLHGPGVAGLDWTEGMMRPDEEGIIRATGATLGGHAIAITGVNLRRGLFKLHQSWGRGFGIGGELYLPFEDADVLRRRQGELCVPVVRA